MKITLTNGYTSLDSRKHRRFCGRDGEKDGRKRYWKEREKRNDGNIDKDWRNTEERGVISELPGKSGETT